MRRTLSLILVAAALTTATLAFAGCELIPGARQKEPPTLLKVSGAGATFPMIRALADEYSGDDLEFRFLPPIHTHGGIAGAAEGELDIGAIARDLEGDEIGLPVTTHFLAQDAIAIWVNPGIGVEKLTKTQIRGIFAGTYRNWSALGGSEQPIVVLDLPEHETARRALVSGLLERSEITTKAAQIYYEGEMPEAVRTTPGAIGYCSLAYVLAQGETMSPVAIDGVIPSPETVASGEYPVSRRIGVVVVGDASSFVTGFVRWATGPEAASALTRAGYAPLGGLDPR